MARRKTNFQIVYNALVCGDKIEMDGFTWIADDKGKIFMRLECYSNGVKQPDRYMDGDVTLNNFIQMCEDLSEEDIICIVASRVLREI